MIASGDSVGRWEQEKETGEQVESGSIREHPMVRKKIDELKVCVNRLTTE